MTGEGGGQEREADPTGREGTEELAGGPGDAISSLQSKALLRVFWQPLKVGLLSGKLPSLVKHPPPLD